MTWHWCWCFHFQTYCSRTFISTCKLTYMYMLVIQDLFDCALGYWVLLFITRYIKQPCLPTVKRIQLYRWVWVYVQCMCVHIYMLSAKYGFGLSADFVAQTPDPRSAQQIRGSHSSLRYLQINCACANLTLKCTRTKCTCGDIKCVPRVQSAPLRRCPGGNATSLL